MRAFNLFHAVSILYFIFYLLKTYYTETAREHSGSDYAPNSAVRHILKSSHNT